jgi:cytochrome oxidase Cu insertion factor (SCO1/SenC/PrrC family)
MGCGRPYEYHGTVYTPPQTAAAVTGTNWDSRPFRLSDLQGKVVLLFFGYTHCPDVCPLTMAELAQLYGQLGEKAGDVAVVFISTDPARDTPERLAQYIPAFHQDFYGVHIPESELTAIKQAYGVYAEKHEDANQEANADYLVDHNSYIYVIDQQGQLRLAFSPDIPEAELLADVEHLVDG